MSDKNHELEQLARIREILFGEQIAAIEQRLEALSLDYKRDLEKLSEDLKTLMKEKETQYTALLKENQEAIDKKLLQIEQDKVDKAKLASLFKQLAQMLEEENKA